MRKGISPLIAVVIIVAIAIALGGLATGWFKTLFKDITGNVDATQGEANACSNSWIKISKVIINSTSGNVKVWVDNIGLNEVTLKQATLVINNGTSCSIGISNSTLPVGEIKRLNATCDIFTATCSNFNDIKVTTTCPGVSDEYNRYDSDPTCNT